LSGRAAIAGMAFFSALGADFAADFAGMAPNVGRLVRIINVCADVPVDQ